MAYADPVVPFAPVPMPIHGACIRVGAALVFLGLSASWVVYFFGSLGSAIAFVREYREIPRSQWSVASLDPPPLILKYDQEHDTWTPALDTWATCEHVRMRWKENVWTNLHITYSFDGVSERISCTAGPVDEAPRLDASAIELGTGLLPQNKNQFESALNQANTKGNN